MEREEQAAFLSKMEGAVKALNKAALADLVENISLVLHGFSCGYPSQFEEVFGIPQKLFKTGAAWDTRKDELTEWQRDDLRRQAQAVVAWLLTNGYPVRPHK